jgi:hypothetical protein
MRLSSRDTFTLDNARSVAVQPSVFETRAENDGGHKRWAKRPKNIIWYCRGSALDIGQIGLIAFDQMEYLLIL